MMAAQETPSERVSRQNVDRTRWEKLDPPEKVTEDCVLWADDKDDILEFGHEVGKKKARRTSCSNRRAKGKVGTRSGRSMAPHRNQ